MVKQKKYPQNEVFGARVTLGVSHLQGIKNKTEVQEWCIHHFYYRTNYEKLWEVDQNG